MQCQRNSRGDPEWNLT